MDGEKKNSVLLLLNKKEEDWKICDEVGADVGVRNDIVTKKNRRKNSVVTR